MTMNNRDIMTLLKEYNIKLDESELVISDLKKQNKQFLEDNQTVNKTNYELVEKNRSL